MPKPATNAMKTIKAMASKAMKKHATGAATKPVKTKPMKGQTTMKTMPMKTMPMKGQKTMKTMPMKGPKKTMQGPGDPTHESPMEWEDFLRQLPVWELDLREKEPVVCQVYHVWSPMGKLTPDQWHLPARDPGLTW